VADRQVSLVPPGSGALVPDGGALHEALVGDALCVQVRNQTQACCILRSHPIGFKKPSTSLSGKVVYSPSAV
jgi:hypothetical protein